MKPFSYITGFGSGLVTFSVVQLVAMFATETTGSTTTGPAGDVAQHYDWPSRVMLLSTTTGPAG